MEIQELKTGENKNLFSLLLFVLSLFLAVLVVSTIAGTLNKIREGRYIGQDIESKNTITVYETGEVYAKPDLAITTFSVVTEKKTVAEALRENTEKMNALIESLKGLAVESKDLKTINFNIYPRYEYPPVQPQIYPYPGGNRVLAGYEVSQSLQVKIRNLEKIGDIIKTAADSGANQVGDLQFTIDNQEELKKQARSEAIEKAKNRAKEITSQLDVKIVRVVNFSENYYLPFYDRFALESAKAPPDIGGAFPSPQIETGENKISVTVTITYEIN